MSFVENLHKRVSILPPAFTIILTLMLIKLYGFCYPINLLSVENSAVIFRSCYYKPTNATKDECYDKEKTVSYIKNVDCKVCDADGCNGASAYGPIALMMIGPVAVAKVLLF